MLLIPLDNNNPDNLCMINHLSILLSGFSIFSLLALLVAYLFFLPDMRKSIEGKIAASLLILSLTALQIGHYLFFTQASPLLTYKAYSLLLIIIPISFFFFSRVILFPEIKYSKFDLLHFIPVAFSFLLTVNQIPLLGFILGACYTLWFSRLIMKLRPQHERFKFELFFFGLFSVIALITFALCLSLPYIDNRIFFVTYSNSISICILLIICALLFYPKLLGDILLITELTYAKSKLTGINTNNKIAELKKIMEEDKVFQNENISLNMVSEEIGLSSHQLSELINTHFKMNFSRYIREQRVNEAKKLLINEPDSSILAISMETGFKSQSNFYTAFKEITGVSPGQYRKSN